MSRRVLLLVLAGSLCATVGLLGREPELAVPGAQDWAARHPDPRALDAESGRSLASQLDGERRNDLALLLAALAAGCVVVAAWPRVQRWTGGASRRSTPSTPSPRSRSR